MNWLIGTALALSAVALYAVRKIKFAKKHSLDMAFCERTNYNCYKTFGKLNICVTVEFGVKMDVKKLRDCISYLHEDVHLLDYEISEISEKFERIGEFKQPQLRVVNGAFDLTREIEFEIDHNFAQGEAAVRFTLLNDEAEARGCHLMLTANHVIHDGISCAFILRKLLLRYSNQSSLRHEPLNVARELNGDSILTTRVPAVVFAMYGLINHLIRSKFDRVKTPAITDRCEAPFGSRYLSIEIPEERVLRMYASCKQRNVTIGNLIYVSVASAMANALPHSNSNSSNLQVWGSNMFDWRRLNPAVSRFQPGIFASPIMGMFQGKSCRRGGLR
jgi:NRPS condensation-like uncharacterized protein